MREIQLTKGYVALVDDEDYDLINTWRWYAQERWFMSGALKVYAARATKPMYNDTVTCRRSTTYIHKVLLQYESPFVCDHIDGNPLNNQRHNLRICTAQENAFNSSKTVKKCTSFYKGVNRQYNKWHASIRHNKKLVHLGTFCVETDAAKIYDQAAIELFGAFAKLNFPYVR